MRKRSRRSDALDHAFEEAEKRAERTSRDEVFQLGKSRDARDLIRDSDNNCRWQAVIVVGESLETNPEAVWDVVREFGDDQDKDMRAAVAKCLLEHLLQQDFDTYFGKVRGQIRDGRSLMIDTLSYCRCGETDDPNYKKAQAFVRTDAGSIEMKVRANPSCSNLQILRVLCG